MREEDLYAQGFHKIVVGIPGRPFPVMVPNPNATSQENAYRLETIEDPENPIVFWSERTYEEVIGMLYRFIPTPTMLPLFYETLRLLRPENDRRIQFYIGRHGSGKSFVGKLIGDMLHPDGSVTINCADRDLNELLFETVLDVASNPGLYSKINQKLKDGTMSNTSLAALRSVVGSAYHDEKGYPQIDFEEIGAYHLETYTNRDGQRETDVVFNGASAGDVMEVVLKIAEVEGLAKEASFMPLKTQLGILPRVWMEGRVPHLEEYNKCKEGTDTCLHPVLQVLNGEYPRCTVFGSGGASFTFDVRDRKPGFFCYLDGNLQADGVATHTLSASANDRVLPNIIQNMSKADWQHRWCQLLTGLPLKVLYDCKKDQWDADPESFTKFLLMIRKMGGIEVPPMQLHYINKWEDVLDATEMMAEYNYAYDQKTNPDSVGHQQGLFPELFSEVDEEFYSMAGGSMRRIIKHFNQAMLGRPKTVTVSQSKGFDLSNDWRNPPDINPALHTHRPELSLGTDIVTEFYDDMARLTMGLGKPNLYASLKADFESFRLRRPDLSEGALSNTLYFEDLLNSQKVTMDHHLQTQELLCDRMRVHMADVDLASQNDFLLPLEMIDGAINKAMKTEPPVLNDERAQFIHVQGFQPLVTVDNLLHQVALLDGIPMSDGRRIDVNPKDLLGHDDFLVAMGLPKVGKKSQGFLWNTAISKALDSPIAEEDEALRISADKSAARLAFTTVLTSIGTNGSTQSVPIHILKDNTKRKMLMVGGPVDDHIITYLDEAQVDYVDRTAMNARSKIRAFLNSILLERESGIEAHLVGAFFHRNHIQGLDIARDEKTLDRMTLTDLLSNENVIPVRPNFATVYSKSSEVQKFLASR